MPPKKDLTGQKFKDFEAIHPLPSRGNYTYWMCRCSCGEMQESRTDRLILGRKCSHKHSLKIGTKKDKLTYVEKFADSKIKVACDCSHEFVMFKQNFLDNNKFKCPYCHEEYPSIKGKRFGSLVVTGDTISRDNKNKHPEVETICDCGVICTKNYNALIRGTEQSCLDCYSKKQDKIRGQFANEHSFSSLSAESSYWIGFIAADGTITNGGVSIQLSAIDQDHLRKLANFTGEIRGLSYVKDRGMCSLNIVSEKIRNDIIGLGINNNRAFTYNPVEDLRWNLDFWRGMIDGDGWIGSTRLTIGFVGSIYACSAFADFCSYHSGGVINVKQKHNIYSVLIGGKRAYRLIDLLYGGNPSFYLDRKMELANKWLNHECYSSHKG